MNLRTAVLVLANFLGVIVILYFLDFFGVTNLYNTIKTRSFLKTQEEVIAQDGFTRSIDKDYIEEAERNKMLESFRIREIEIAKKEMSLSNLQRDLQREKEEMETEKENFQKQREKIKRELENKESYEKKIENLSLVYYNMPPENAVERILELKDDLLIIDVLKEMDRYASTQNKQSIVPFLYSLMPKEDASRLLKKSTVSLN